MNLVYSMRNRSACIRIPMYSDSPKAKRIEFRCPDAAANPYLAFSAMLMAGLDGIQKGLDAGEPADWDLFEEDRGVAQVPGSLAEALDALERDHEFLTAGGVFSEELIRTWIDYKRENEADVVRLRPHPGGVLPLLRLLMLELEARPTDTLAASRRSSSGPSSPTTGRRSRRSTGTACGTVSRRSRPRFPPGKTWDAAHLRDHRLVADAARRGRRLGGALAGVDAALLRSASSRTASMSRARPAGSGSAGRCWTTLIAGAEAAGIWTIQTVDLPGEPCLARTARAVRLPRRRHARARCEARRRLAGHRVPRTTKRVIA